MTFDRPRNAKIIEIDDDSELIKTFFFDLSFDARPGQYVMVWIRGVDEIPMALSSRNSITVKKVGDATSELFKYKVGDHVGLRGSYGNGFTLKGKRILIVAGGIGVASLIMLAEEAASKNIDVTTLLGAKNKDELLFVDGFERAGGLVVSTEDGSLGRHGLVTDLLDGIHEYDQVYVSGPEPMMMRILNICKSYGMEEKAQFSIRRYIKCGIGICGSCCIDPSGLCVCRDGPVFTGDQLLESEFGKHRRDRSGRKYYPEK
jgi:dihydroorotate dehydrogenase electron transfer subunit